MDYLCHLSPHFSFFFLFLIGNVFNSVFHKLYQSILEIFGIFLFYIALFFFSFWISPRILEFLSFFKKSYQFFVWSFVFQIFFFCLILALLLCEVLCTKKFFMFSFTINISLRGPKMTWLGSYLGWLKTLWGQATGWLDRKPVVLLGQHYVQECVHVFFPLGSYHFFREVTSILILWGEVATSIWGHSYFWPQVKKSVHHFCQIMSLNIITSYE